MRCYEYVFGEKNIPQSELDEDNGSKQRINRNTIHWSIGGSRGVYGGCNPPFQISKIKESNKTKQKIEDNPLEKEEERKSCMCV